MPRSDGGRRRNRLIKLKISLLRDSASTTSSARTHARPHQRRRARRYDGFTIVELELHPSRCDTQQSRSFFVGLNGKRTAQIDSRCGRRIHGERAGWRPKPRRDHSALERDPVAACARRNQPHLGIRLDFDGSHQPQAKLRARNLVRLKQSADANPSVCRSAERPTKLLPSSRGRAELPACSGRSPLGAQ
jgi:hypothetical protein